MLDIQNIVIIGGGYAGIEAFKELDKKRLNNKNIILISKTNFFYHNIAAPRALVESQVAEDICIKLDRVIKGPNRHFIHGNVQSINNNKINYLNIETNETFELSFEYLILSLGSVYQQPFHSKEFDRLKQIESIEKSNQFLKTKANRILIIGGGAVGVELAGELMTDLENKLKITLITSSNRLVPNMSESFSKKALEILTGSNNSVEIIFNDKINVNNIENYQNNKLTTEKGKEIEFDAYFVCVGVKPCTGFIKNTMGEWLNENGFLKVNESFQLLSNSNIFAIGDCCDVNEPKLAVKATGHASIVAYNIEQLIKSSNKLKKYSISNSKFMVLSVGRNNGVFQFGSICFKGFIPTSIKSKNVFVDRYKSLMGY